MKNQTITRDGLKEIYDIACGSWKRFYSEKWKIIYFCTEQHGEILELEKGHAYWWRYIISP